ncbi:MAG: TauD/TfdA family dioxygenase [Planctomycetota bacterium]|jgi:taurine dioxygenase|nr:TauD/TfdA family dioxygenase [Planctomycetota bacterium]MDG2142441.1 TauD/TfdA family dioxygenase [Planctomycetota bacterium]
MSSTTSPIPACLSSLDVELPLVGGIGARIAGLLPEAITAEIAAGIRKLVYEHKMVYFQGMDLDDERYIKLAGRIGRPQVYFQENYHHPDHPEIFVSSNLPFRGQKIGVAGTGAYWHSDCSFFGQPLSMTMISPRVLPEADRKTKFLDLNAAFEALPEELRSRLENVRAVHEAKWRYKVQPSDVDKSLTELLAAFDEMAPAVTHPAITQHPVNGRKLLYVSSGFVVGFEGLPKVESDELLQAVFKHMEREQFIQTHVWRAHEVTLWDNRQLNHCAGDKYEKDHSTSYRIGVYDKLDFYPGVQGGEGPC